MVNVKATLYYYCNNNYKKVRLMIPPRPLKAGGATIAIVITYRPEKR